MDKRARRGRLCRGVGISYRRRRNPRRIDAIDRRSARCLQVSSQTSHTRITGRGRDGGSRVDDPRGDSHSSGCPRRMGLDDGGTRRDSSRANTERRSEVARHELSLSSRRDRRVAPRRRAARASFRFSVCVQRRVRLKRGRCSASPAEWSLTDAPRNLGAKGAMNANENGRRACQAPHCAHLERRRRKLPAYSTGL
jgi:hypothetical protein